MILDRLPAPEGAEGGSLALPAPELVGAILAMLNARTARTYQSDFRDFARFVGLAPERWPEALRTFVGAGQGRANAAALAYRLELADRGLAPGTVARRLAALRAACKAARRLGLIAWGLDVPGPKPTPYRDTRGPGLAGWRRLLAVARIQCIGPRGHRDLAILRLLYDLALRRGEVVGLDLEHLDAEGSGVGVLGKGRTDRQRITLPEPTLAALAAWVEQRGRWPGPLFVGIDRFGRVARVRLTGEAVRRVVARLGRAAGLERVPRPHGLRHAAITRALDLGHDVRSVRRFSRHAKLDTVLVYDDNRQDLAGGIARGLAEE